MSQDFILEVTYLIVLLAMVLFWFITQKTQKLGETVRAALAWVIIFIGVAAAYGLWQKQNLLSNTVQVVSNDGALRIARSLDGHFHARVIVNDVPIDTLIDTGATHFVLAHDDARRAGIDLGRVVYTGVANTANGQVRLGNVSLDRVEFGPFQMQNAPAVVTDGALQKSLLGMSFLNQFGTIRIEDGMLILNK